LSEIPHIDDTMPDSGWLYFFYDRYCEPWAFAPADRGCCRVLYAATNRESLCRLLPPPDSLPEHTAHPCLVAAWPELTLPYKLPGVDDGTDADDAYGELLDELMATHGVVQHRLLGHPQVIQNPMEAECELASNEVDGGSLQDGETNALAGGAADWRLLLQVDTDEDGPGWMWGDMGRIYFWIKQQDLAAHRFDQVWLILQCS
jgi:uncharacterized protein YwqG